jgi:hypothetical protein
MQTLLPQTCPESTSKHFSPVCNLLSSLSFIWPPHSTICHCITTWQKSSPPVRLVPCYCLCFWNHKPIQHGSIPCYLTSLYLLTPSTNWLSRKTLSSAFFQISLLKTLEIQLPAKRGLNKTLFMWHMFIVWFMTCNKQNMPLRKFLGPRLFNLNLAVL